MVILTLLYVDNFPLGVFHSCLLFLLLRRVVSNFGYTLLRYEYLNIEWLDPVSSSTFPTMGMGFTFFVSLLLIRSTNLNLVFVDCNTYDFNVLFSLVFVPKQLVWAAASERLLSYSLISSVEGGDERASSRSIPAAWNRFLTMRSTWDLIIALNSLFDFPL